MEEHTLSEWIDQYLQGTISPGNKKQLEELMATDPSVAELVQDSKEAYKALLHERNRQLREKLRELDKGDTRESGFAPGWFGWVFFPLFLMLLYAYLACVHFNPASVAKRNFTRYPSIENTSVSSPEIHERWARANDAFAAKDYKGAIVLYASLTADDSINNAYARWNILLAQLALEGPTSNWRLGIDLFAGEAPQPLASRAEQLAALFDSWLYHLFYVRLRENLSAIKPKLI